MNIEHQSKIDKFQLAIVNCCAISNKRVELESFLNLFNVDLLCGTESHLNESILNSKVFPTNYHVYRKDRNIHGGGGVFILVKSSIPSSQVKCNTSIELIWVRIHNNTDNDIIIGSFYCPPHSPITVLDELAQSISDIRTMYPSAKIIIGGDFNSPGINWSNKSLITSYISRQFREKL